MNIFCVGCKRSLKPEKTGQYVLDVRDPNRECVWHADVWRCPQCGVMITTGFGKRPVGDSLDMSADEWALRKFSYEQEGLIRWEH